MLTPNEQWERRIFSEFAEAAGVNVDPSSVVSGKPPHADILFKVAGQSHCAELVEITDQGVAKNHFSGKPFELVLKVPGLQSAPPPPG